MKQRGGDKILEKWEYFFERKRFHAQSKALFIKARNWIFNSFSYGMGSRLCSESSSP